MEVGAVDGGMFCWARLTGDVSATDLFAAAIDAGRRLRPRRRLLPRRLRPLPPPPVLHHPDPDRAGPRRLPPRLRPLLDHLTHPGASRCSCRHEHLLVSYDPVRDDTNTPRPAARRRDRGGHDGSGTRSRDRFRAAHHRRTPVADRHPVAPHPGRDLVALVGVDVRRSRPAVGTRPHRTRCLGRRLARPKGRAPPPSPARHHDPSAGRRSRPGARAVDGSRPRPRTGTPHRSCAAVGGPSAGSVHGTDAGSSVRAARGPAR